MAREQRETSVSKEFKRRKTRQFYAVVAVVFLLIAVLWRLNQPGFLFGELSKGIVMAVEIAIIAAFLFFTAANWRCPSCSRYLGRDISQQRCRKCGTPLV
jgi:TRAP-type C4-dicarboxylate transport system permease large subunit